MFKAYCHFVFRFIPLHERVFLIEMAIVGAIGGIAVTYFALDSIINGGIIIFFFSLKYNCEYFYILQIYWEY